MRWENREFGAVQVSQKTQKIIALVCGLLLLAVVIAILFNNYSQDKPTDSKTPTSNTQEAKKTDTTEKTKKAEDTQPVVTPQPEKPAEPTQPAQPPKETEAAKPETKPPAITEIQPTSQNFTFTAQPGDSYTALARDAVQKYVKANSITITAAQQSQAAATLAANAGSPRLDIGEVVTIEQSDIAARLGVVAPSAPQTKDAPVNSSDKNKTTKAVVDYTFTAVSGDSYSKLARRAISDYAASTKLNLTPSQRIAAETSIIAVAGFPAINVEQVVTYSGVTIKDAVGAAQMLSEAQLASWQPYANLAGL